MLLDSYLIITTLMHEEKLVVCDHEITQIIQFADASFKHTCIITKFSSNP